MLINRSFYIILIVITGLHFSCIEKQPLYLNSTQLKLVDTLAKHQIIPLRAELDSLCELRFEEEVKRATDSIVIERIREINKKMVR